MVARLDPTGTTTLVRQFENSITQRFRQLAQMVTEKLVDENALGLEDPTPSVDELALAEVELDAYDHLSPPPPPLSRAFIERVTQNVLSRVHNVEKPVWKWKTNPQKLEAFNTWLANATGGTLLERDAHGQPWVAPHIKRAHVKGLLNAYVDAKGHRLRGGLPAFFAGSKVEFVSRALSDPKTLEKVRILATRAYEELRGVSAVAATQMNRILANGLIEGKTAKAIAREMVEKIDGLSKQRARAIAQNELVYSHAEGQLDAYETLGVKQVGILSEWATRGDSKVCKVCAALEGVVFKISEARGLIPRHHGCRCLWVPPSRARQVARLKRALTKSLQAETGSRATRKPGARSGWAGKVLQEKLARKKKRR